MISRTGGSIGQPAASTGGAEVRLPGGSQISVTNCSGAIAQLGERLNGIQEVSGSIPLGSTNFKMMFF